MSELLARRKAQLVAPPVPPMKLAHFVLKTTRFVDMVAWYKNVLQLLPSFEGSEIAFLTFDEEHHRIAIVAFPGMLEQPPGAGGIEHIAFTYRSLGELLANYMRLRTADIFPVWCINHGPTMSLYYRDPDGNQLELQVENLATIEMTDEYLMAKYSENPIGVEFDPEEVVRRYLDGVSLAELTERPDIGRRLLSDPVLHFDARRSADSNAEQVSKEQC